jgi:hypothetical protein
VRESGIAGSQLGDEFGRTFDQRAFEHRRVLVVDERPDLLHMRVFVRDHMDEAVFDVRVHPFGRAQRLEADLQAGDRTSHAYRFAATHGDRDRRHASLRIEPHQVAQRDFDSPAHLWQHGHAASGLDVELGMLRQRSGDSLAGNLAQLSKVMQTLRTRVEIISLELIRGRMSASRVVDLVEALDVFGVNLGRRTLRPRADRRARRRTDDESNADSLQFKPTRRSRRQRSTPAR